MINFADTMVSNHKLAQTDLKKIADSLKVVLPTSQDSAYFKSKENLDTLTGSAFDSTYVATQIAAHQNAVSVLQGETENGQNKSLMDYANKYLPIIQMHLAMGDSLAIKIK